MLGQQQSWAEHPVGRAAHPGRAAVQDMSVDHGRGYITVAEDLLHGPDVAAVLGSRTSDAEYVGWRAWRCRPAAPRAGPRVGGRSRVGGAADAARSRGPRRCAWRGRPTAGRHPDTFGPALSTTLPSRRRRPCPARACSRTLARCRTSSALTMAGSMVVRSLSPLPPRTTIWLDPKSTSWTPSRQHSRTRRPAPYSRHTMMRGAQPRRSITARTSSRVRTTGRRVGRLARTISSPG